MNKHQIILLLAGILLVVAIYLLPRSVVENDTDSQLASTTPHELELSPDDEAVIFSLRNQMKESLDIKKSINFADSLASIFLKYQLVDSAARYASRILELDRSAYARYISGMIYYQSFQNAAKMEEAGIYATKAKEIFEGLLAEDPSNAGLKNKLAMTLMTTDNPMQGVMMLREILEEDPENRQAIFNLGLLAIRSGQYERAKERFLKLTELNPNDFEAVFYLGVIYAELDQKEKALEQFKKYTEYQQADPALKATATDYIKELESI